MLKILKGLKRKRRMARQDVKGRVILGTGFGNSTTNRLGSGKARNLSASGISFETGEDLLVGSTIAFTIALDMGNEELTTMRCSGTVIRKDVLEDGRVAFAVKFDEQKIER